MSLAIYRRRNFAVYRIQFLGTPTASLLYSRARKCSPASPMFRFLRLTLPVLFSVCDLSAQQGDRPDEIQHPIPAEWKIPPAPILTAEEALRTITVAPGFRIELAAAEPLIGDPVAAVFGPDGRLWVVEMRGYMPDVDGTGEDDPVGSVVVIEDTNGDGRYDKRTVFLDQLVLPRSVSLVGDGVLIAEPPHLWFARDMNGDDVADSKIEIASDYGGVGNPEHMANGLVWMMDNWIYSANHTARYRYDGDGKFTSDSTITRGQWGVTQDDIGRIYYNSNSDPLRFDAVPSAYLKRNPHLVDPKGTNVEIAPANLPTWPGRITPGVNRGYKNLRADGTLIAVTAACSPVIYRGELFPAEFRGDAFICEPSGNLVKRIRLLERDGVISGTNAYEQTEFLTSSDERFRPVSMYNGPDGALYIVDMYRGVIQHRTYVTSYLRAQVKDRRLEEGRGLGRIWRIVPNNVPTAKTPPNLAQASPLELVQQLASTSGWVRDTAQRLLVEGRYSAAIAPLQIIVRSPDSAVLARLHALWTLEGIGALDLSSVLVALGDSDVRVCAAAIRLAEAWLINPANEEIFQRVTEAMSGSGREPPPNVVLQQVLSLGFAASYKKHETMIRLAERHGRRPFVADALVSGLAGQEEAFVESMATRATAANATPVIASAVAAVLQSGDTARITRVLFPLTDSATTSSAQTAILDGVDAYIPRRADGARVVGSLPAEPAPLVALAKFVETAQSARAADLLQFLRWPGKPGVEMAAITLTPAETELFEHGRAQYVSLCANCHQPGGQGLPGLAPALVNSRWVLGSPKLAARIILCGKEDDGKIMPALRGMLDDAAIANVLTFIRNSWGHSAKPVELETVAAVRAETANRTEPFREAELVELSGSQ
jgi:mono/diheme cytochrome c family protein/glucose/arabinose dehydrogenase